MKHPIVIEPGDERRTGSVVVPDQPGCFSAAWIKIEYLGEFLGPVLAKVLF